MDGVDLRRRVRLDDYLQYVGLGWIVGALYDLGPYPGVVPDEAGRVRGELYTIAPHRPVLAALDDVEGYRPHQPEQSLYIRRLADVMLDAGGTVTAWVYFYNGSLAGTRRISSGDYREYLRRLAVAGGPDV